MPVWEEQLSGVFSGALNNAPPPSCDPADPLLQGWEQSREPPPLKNLEALLASFPAPQKAEDMAPLITCLSGTAQRRRDDADMIKFIHRERSWLAARLDDQQADADEPLSRLDAALESFNLGICRRTLADSDHPETLRRVLQKLYELDPDGRDALIPEARQALQAKFDDLAEPDKKAFLADWLGHLAHRKDKLKNDEAHAQRIQGMLSECRHLNELVVYAQLTGLRKKTRRFQKRLHREYKETRLRDKMEGILGARGVRILNTIILLMVGLIVLLLYAQFRFTFTESQARMLMYVDLGICCVFLADFFFRLILAGPWYFKSHALLEFFPAIPYAFFLPGAETLNAAQMAPKVVRILPMLIKLAGSPRILRPLIRSLRLCTFLMGGLDRIMKQLKPLLDHDIQIGWTREGGLSECSGREAPVLAVQNKLTYVIRVNFRELPQEEGLRFLEAYACTLTALAGVFAHSAPPLPVKRDQSQRLLTLGEAATCLRNLDPVSVEVALGSGTTRRLAAALKYFDVFPVKHLPVIRDLARASRIRENAGAVCLAARVFAGMAERIELLFHLFADFRGVGTGPQILDRASAVVIKTARRYATRLLILGGLFIFATAVVKILPVGFLNPVATFFQDILGIPIIVLGLLSSGVLCFALYMKRIAGEALESWRNTAEAQFINLGANEKYRNEALNHGFLAKRVLADESRLFEQACADRSGHLAKHEDRVFHLHRDWQDGAMLHASDIKLSEQLLGNVAVQQLRGFCLRESPAGKRRRERCSLANRSASLFQPQFYFQLMTDTLSVEVAKLIIEYNRYAVPLHELDQLTEPERSEYHGWLNEEDKGRRKRGSLLWQTEFRTTFFNAQHFLSPDPQVLTAIEETFGPDMVRRVRNDRSALIQELYGLWPVNLGSVNPYRLYQTYCASFRIFFLPLLLIWLGLKGTVFSVKRTSLMLKEIRGRVPDGDIRRNQPAPFSVAKRKICRMRQALLEEATELRAHVDPAFLGICPPGCRPPEGALPFQADLPFLQKSSMDQFIHHKRRRLRNDFVRFRQMLKERGWNGRDTDHAAAALAGQAVAHAEEALHACFMAYCLNWHNVKVKLHAEKLLSEFFGRLRRHAEPEQHFLVRLRNRISLGLKLCRKKHRVARRLYSRVLRFVPEVSLHSQFIIPFLKSGDEVQDAARLADQSGDNRRAELDDGLAILKTVARRPTFWTEQRITVKTLQSIAILDILSYFRLIHQLGEYHDGEENAELNAMLEKS